MKKVAKFLKDLWDAELTILFMILFAAEVFIVNFIIKIELLIALIKGINLEEMVTAMCEYSEKVFNKVFKKDPMPEEVKYFILSAVFWPIKI